MALKADKVTLKWNAAKFQAELADKIDSGMTAALLFVEGKAKVLVSRGNVKGTSPSAPGEPPKVVTGTLRSNIATEKRREGKNIVGVLGVRRGPANKYARRLELGFVGTDRAGRNINQAARPYLRPTILKNKRAILQRLVRRAT